MNKLVVVTSLYICALIPNVNLHAETIPWRKAVNNVNWVEHRATLPPFCVVPLNKQRAPFNGPSYRGDMIWGNHLCSHLAKTPVCRAYFGNDRRECLSATTEGYIYWLSNAKNPNFGLRPYLHTGLGNVYFEIGKKAEAIREYQLALKKNPKYLKAYKSLIDAFIDLKQYDNAQHYLDKAMAIKPHKAFKRRQEKLNKLNPS